MLAEGHIDVGKAVAALHIHKHIPAAGMEVRIVVHVVADDIAAVRAEVVGQLDFRHRVKGQNRGRKGDRRRHKGRPNPLLPLELPDFQHPPFNGSGVVPQHPHRGGFVFPLPAAGGHVDDAAAVSLPRLLVVGGDGFVVAVYFAQVAQLVEQNIGDGVEPVDCNHRQT